MLAGCDNENEGVSYLRVFREPHGGYLCNNDITGGHMILNHMIHSQRRLEPSNYLDKQGSN